MFATRNEVIRHLKFPKITLFEVLLKGTAIRPPRILANGCDTSTEHTFSLNPRTPRVKREPLLCIREKILTKKNNSGKNIDQKE